MHTAPSQQSLHASEGSEAKSGCTQDNEAFRVRLVGGIMARFKTAFFAFPDDPPELKQPILAANDLIKTNDNVRVVTWPQLKIFGAVIPEEVREGIDKTDVLLCDITRPNLNVYYEIGYCIGLGKSLAPVLNVSFMHAAADIQKDGMFDIIGYKSY